MQGRIPDNADMKRHDRKIDHNRLILGTMSFYPVFKEQALKAHEDEPSKLNAKR
jgi:hypothetical protein